MESKKFASVGGFLRDSLSEIRKITLGQIATGIGISGIVGGLVLIRDWLAGRTSVPNWLLCLLALAAAGGIAAAGYAAFKRYRARPSVADFTEGSFEKLWWTWSYDVTGRPGDLVARCPDCDWRLNVGETEDEDTTLTIYGCSRCNGVKGMLRGGRGTVRDGVARRIEAVAASPAWKDRIKAAADRRSKFAENP